MESDWYREKKVSRRGAEIDPWYSEGEGFGGYAQALFNSDGKPIWISERAALLPAVHGETGFALLSQCACKIAVVG